MYRSRGFYIHQFVCPAYVTQYNQKIYGVNQGEQLKEHDDGFYSKANFKKWYKRGHIGLCDFGLLELHIAWNISCEKIVVHGVRMS